MPHWNFVYYQYVTHFSVGNTLLGERKKSECLNSCHTTCEVGTVYLVSIHRLLDKYIYETTGIGICIGKFNKIKVDDW